MILFSKNSRIPHEETVKAFLKESLSVLNVVAHSDARFGIPLTSTAVQSGDATASMQETTSTQLLI